MTAKQSNTTADNLPSVGMRFQTFAAVVLGGLTGLLIGLPLAQSSSPLTGTIVILASGLAGVLVGYRRRESRAFLYLCFVAILVLTGIINSSMEPKKTSSTDVNLITV